MVKLQSMPLLCYQTNPLPTPSLGDTALLLPIGRLCLTLILGQVQVLLCRQRVCARLVQPVETFLKNKFVLIWSRSRSRNAVAREALSPRPAVVYFLDNSAMYSSTCAAAAALFKLFTRVNDRHASDWRHPRHFESVSGAHSRPLASVICR
jgi:hypothetical protein